MLILIYQSLRIITMGLCVPGSVFRENLNWNSVSDEGFGAVKLHGTPPGVNHNHEIICARQCFSGILK
jgi:hypothetical protein